MYFSNYIDKHHIKGKHQITKMKIFLEDQKISFKIFFCEKKNRYFILVLREDFFFIFFFKGQLKENLLIVGVWERDMREAEK